MIQDIYKPGSRFRVKGLGLGVEGLGLNLKHNPTGLCLGNRIHVMGIGSQNLEVRNFRLGELRD